MNTRFDSMESAIRESSAAQVDVMKQMLVEMRAQRLPANVAPRIAAARAAEARFEAVLAERDEGTPQMRRRRAAAERSTTAWTPRRAPMQRVARAAKRMRREVAALPSEFTRVCSVRARVCVGRRGCVNRISLLQQHATKTRAPPHHCGWRNTRRAAMCNIIGSAQCIHTTLRIIRLLAAFSTPVHDPIVTTA